MDRQTFEFYRANAPETARHYAGAESSVARLFPVAFSPGARVLDLGCGSGRDLDALIQAGFDGYGVDGSPEMIREAIRHFPHLAERITVDELPQLKTISDHSYEGILCSAVLMHLPEEMLFLLQKYRGKAGGKFRVAAFHF
jgi:2-polyprenyl-3-methyl-5-hydroxy-6-metoxy-1,4-benzoquinol methylase